MSMRDEFEKLVATVKEAEPGQERAEAIEKIAHAFQHLEGALGEFPNDDELYRMLPLGWRAKVLDAHKDAMEIAAKFFEMRRVYEQQLEEQARAIGETHGTDVAGYAASRSGRLTAI
jgi:hypothetical protein